MTSLLRLEELLRLWEEDADETNCDRETGADPEHRLPGVGCATDTQVGTRGKDVTERVTLLQDTTHETTSVDTADVSICKLIRELRSTYGQFSRAMEMAFP